MRKIDLSRFKKKAIKESYKQLTKNRYDEIFNLIDEIAENLENSYVEEREREEILNNSKITGVGIETSQRKYYYNLKIVLQRLQEINEILIIDSLDDQDIIFEGKSNLYKAGELKLDDGTSVKLTSSDAKFLNDFAGVSLKWNRALTKDLKGFKEVLLLSKT